MMLLFFAVYVLICIYGVKLNDEKEANYLSMENTAAIKGIFILLVFFSHFNSYVEVTNCFDKIYKSIVDFFGQTMVTMFLFYSGYGIMESIKTKGKEYVKSMPSKRILHTLIKFDCAVLLFWLVGVCLEESFGFSQILLSLVAWESLGNSNWYIFVILFLYTITYFVFISDKKRNYLFLTLITLFVVCVAIVANVYFNIKPYYWFDTILCYNLGMIFSLIKPHVDKMLNRNVLCWFVAEGILIVACILLCFNRSIIINMMYNIIFCMMVLLLTMKVTLKNNALVWCGKHLFEIYILQRIPMIIFKNIGIASYNTYLYFICCMVCTLILIIPFNHITGKLLKKIDLIIKNN